jgi:hypothetical protein
VGSLRQNYVCVCVVVCVCVSVCVVVCVRVVVSGCMCNACAAEMGFRGYRCLEMYVPLKWD